MRKITFILLFFLFITVSYGQHTFSIVAVDPVTGEIGSAGATCIAAEDGAQAISDIVLGVGAIHTQSFYSPTNQNNARTRMIAGDTPEEIMQWLQDNDVSNDPSARQYTAVTLNDGDPLSAAFTGPNCFEEFIHVTGPNYSIAGNILISEDVVTDMETAFLNTDGTLAEKLMAALQGAKRPGADVRCLDEGISSASAFIRVADPSDTDSSYGNLSLDLNVWITSEIFEPIDELQILFDQALSTEDASLVTGVSVYPNPSQGELFIKSVANLKEAILYNVTGQEVSRFPIIDNLTSLDVSRFGNGVYFLSLQNSSGTLTTQKIIINK
ncbi:hypothetical protein GCM10011344_44130 [Dokdonia pacifica]|uniref:Por secretion system C-terminal sorting domain-containing protein n=1 Tax=Dokdonia pacifica TaxID=1627892 RepID=A0A239CKW6_9FLAO|nr:DUF1028 domain-containing protein [Dokdonia pacifica]GGG38421.1 hypothetical protein GCM10011344_44130 [Dokdonia pacifica]SNS20321.1 Por secretion system C-terminal sorting domain-containing protein [Dokdonia pacifica]